ncbi:MAG: hypothetical protein ACYDA9_00500 [Terriglobia bacterium]
MNVERTIEFLLKNQASMDARFNAKFDRADQRFAKAEKRLDRLEHLMRQNNHLVTRLARLGLSLRSDVRRCDRSHEDSVRKTDENLAKVAESLAEMDGKLNGLIDIMDRHLRGNGKQK